MPVVTSATLFLCDLFISMKESFEVGPARPLTSRASLTSCYKWHRGCVGSWRSIEGALCCRSKRYTTLASFLNRRSGGAKAKGSSAYNKPAMNTADAPIFFLVGICSCQIAWTGRTTVTKFETTLKIAATRMIKVALVQLPGMFGCQYLSIGEQLKMQANVMAI